MQKVNFNGLNQWIESRRSDVERKILRERKNERLVRTRERDNEEQKVLDRFCIERWKRAEQEGKIKYISDRKWRYDFD